MNIVSENHWEFVEGRVDNVRAESDFKMSVVLNAHKIHRMNDRIRLNAVQHEFDVCRNALMVSLNGNKDAVLDAYDQAYRSRAKNKGWLY